MLDGEWGVVWECAIGRNPPHDLIKRLGEFIKCGQPDQMVFE